MKYLQIPDYQVNTENGLFDLIFPDDDVESDYILYGSVYMVPETHKNIAFIIMRLPNCQWYNEEEGPVRFIRYA